MNINSEVPSYSNNWTYKTIPTDAKELAIYYTVEYFKNKQVTQDIFMRHLETVYNFLLEGKVIYK